MNESHILANDCVVDGCNGSVCHLPTCEETVFMFSLVVLLYQSNVLQHYKQWMRCTAIKMPSSTLLNWVYPLRDQNFQIQFNSLDFISFESIFMQLSNKTADSERGKAVNENVPTVKLYTFGC